MSGGDYEAINKALWDERGTVVGSTTLDLSNYRANTYSMLNPPITRSSNMLRTLLILVTW